MTLKWSSKFSAYGAKSIKRFKVSDCQIINRPSEELEPNRSSICKNKFVFKLNKYPLNSFPGINYLIFFSNSKYYFHEHLNIFSILLFSTHPIPDLFGEGRKSPNQC